VTDGEALPHAMPVAMVALRAFRAGRTVSADQAAPEYIRDKVAQTTAERMAAKAAQSPGHAPATQTPLREGGS
jgi:tRNA threonylcarbamoyladenosine biosynthesis protein TsaB